MGNSTFALGDTITTYDFEVLTVNLLALIHGENPAVSRFSVCSSTAAKGALAMMDVSPAKILEWC